MRNQRLMTWRTSSFSICLIFSTSLILINLIQKKLLRLQFLWNRHLNWSIRIWLIQTKMTDDLSMTLFKKKVTSTKKRVITHTSKIESDKFKKTLKIKCDNCRKHEWECKKYKVNMSNICLRTFFFKYKIKNYKYSLDFTFEQKNVKFETLNERNTNLNLNEKTFFNEQIKTWTHKRKTSLDFFAFCKKKRISFNFKLSVSFN